MAEKIHSHIGKIIIAALILVITAGMIIRLNGVTRTELVNRTGQTFETGVVVEILQDNLQNDGTRVGQQTVVVHMTSGEKQGEDLVTTSNSGYLFGAPCEVGMKVVVMQSVSGDTVITTVYSIDRKEVIIGFAALYIAALCLVGGMKGLRGALGLIYTFGAIIYIYLPLVYLGYSPFWVSVFICVITTLVTMLLIGGFARKTICATLGTMAGVIIAGAAATVFSNMTGVTGWNVSDIESLMTLQQVNGIQVGGLLFSGLLISALGAVMDVAMSISRRSKSIHEPAGIDAGRYARGPRHDGNRFQHPDPGVCRRQPVHAGVGLRLRSALSADHQFQQHRNRGHAGTFRQLRNRSQRSRHCGNGRLHLQDGKEEKMPGEHCGRFCISIRKFFIHEL